MQGADAALSWTTSNEVNTQLFTIQRSRDSTAFAAIGTVPALSTPGTNSYGYTDKGLSPGDWFYRLKMQDRDGNFTYSLIVALTVAASTRTAMVLYPNPVDDLLSVQLTEMSAGKRTVQLTDILGQVLQSQEPELSLGLNTLTFHTATLSSGSYFIVVSGSDGPKLVQGFIKK